MPRAIRSWRRRIRDSVHQEGFWRFLFRAARAPVYREAHVDSVPLQHEIEEDGEVVPDLTVRTAEEDDGAALIALRPEYRPEMLRARFRAGDACFISLVDECIASARWVSLRRVHLDYLGLVLPLQHGEIYIYEVFTRPEHRAKVVRKATSHALQEHYRSLGFRSNLGYVIPWRKPFGPDFRFRVATIRILRLGPLRKFWVRTYGPQADYWRERLKELRWA